MAFSQRDAKLLYDHLQALADVELFTIPFYLTAANSFTEAALANTDLHALQQEAVSVAVQEMYHLQQACNLMNVFNVTPVIPKLTLVAGKSTLVPHLDPGNKAFYAELGNLPAAIKAMLEIESPDPQPGPVVPNAEVTYRSIADLYSATLTLLARYLSANELTPAALDPHFTPGNKQVAYGAFQTRFNYNAISTRLDVAHTANAITDQGEGTVIVPEGSMFKFGEEGRVRPEYQGRESDRFYTQDLYTHYYRFKDILTKLENVDASNFYQAKGVKSGDLPVWAPPYETLAAAVNTIWSFLLDQIQAGFASGNLPPADPAAPSRPGFNSAMIAFKYVLPMVWQYGKCPSFEYREGVKIDDVQKAMDDIDPWCLFHWDAATAEVRTKFPKELNACQGLNVCKGHGWGGIATQPGDGACATADPHTCVGSNSCTAQGGCGYFSEGLPASDQWVPGHNTALPNNTGTGGCQTPISPRQVFHDYPDSSFTKPGWDTLKPLRGTSVWTRARNLLAQKIQKDPSDLPEPLSKQGKGVDYDGTKRRGYVAPTSTS